MGAILPPLVLVPLFLAALWAADRAAEHPLPSPGLGLAEAPGVCTPWQPVADSGFGLDTHASGDPDVPPYQGEDAFELAVFKGQLYVGMEADNALGARLWRTRRGVQHPQGQEDWEEVIADAGGRPWGIEDRALVDHIDSLAEFDGMLYVSTASRGGAGGARLFRSATGDPGSWEDALAGVGPGFGDPDNENFKDMQVFDGRLCGGTWNEANGAEVWCSADGTQWSQVNRSGFGQPENVIIWSGEVFRDRLYFGVQRIEVGAGGGRISAARVYRTASLSGKDGWELVFDGGPFSFWAGLFGAPDGMLYAAVPGRHGLAILRSETGSPGTWELAGRPGMDNNRYNTSTVTDGAVVHQGRLTVAVQNPLIGFRVWQMTHDGFWEVLGSPETYERSDRAAQLIIYNGSLYAWVTDYYSGQSVLRTTCAASAPEAEPQIFISLAVFAVLFSLFGFVITHPVLKQS